MNPEYAEELRGALGTICEVLGAENQILFVGVIQQYSRARNEVQVELRKRESTPRGVLYHAPVKIRYREGNGKDRVVVLYGRVSRNAAEYWWIEVEHVISTAERREHFRQRVRAHGNVMNSRGEQSECELDDISLSGVRFHTEAVYMEGETLLLSGFRLRPGGPVHSLSCLVRRVGPDMEGKGIHTYGCSFLGLRLWQEDELCRDIFALQKRDINRK